MKLVSIKFEGLKSGEVYTKKGKSKSEPSIKVKFIGEKNGLFTFTDIDNWRSKHIFLTKDIEKNILVEEKE